MGPGDQTPKARLSPGTTSRPGPPSRGLPRPKAGEGGVGRRPPEGKAAGNCGKQPGRGPSSCPTGSAGPEGLPGAGTALPSCAERSHGDRLCAQGSARHGPPPEQAQPERALLCTQGTKGRCQRGGLRTVSSRCPCQQAGGVRPALPDPAGWPQGWTCPRGPGRKAQDQASAACGPRPPSAPRDTGATWVLRRH